MTENLEPVTVVVTDDQAAVREGLVLLLGTLPGITVVGQAEDGVAAVETVAATQPQVVLMDLNMPRCRRWRPRAASGLIIRGPRSWC